MKRFSIVTALEYVAVPWAVWTLYVQVLVYARASFNHLLLLSFIPLAIAGGLVFWMRREGARTPPAQAPAAPTALPDPLGPILALVAALAVRAMGWTTPASVLLLLFALWGFYRTRAGGRGTAPSAAEAAPLPNARLDLLLACAATGLVLLPALFVTQPGFHDDSFYLGTSVATLDYPDLPLRRYDFYYGWVDPPIRYLLVHRPQAFEITNAVVTWITGIPSILVYFTLTPVAGVLLWATVNHAFATHFLPGRGGLVLILLAAMLLLVGGGQYGADQLIVRLYRGKHLFVMAVTPWIWLSAWRFAERPSLRRGLVLASVQAIGVGLTVTATVIAPLAAAAAMAAAWIARSCGWKTVVAAAAASLPAIWTLAFILLERGEGNMTGTMRRGQAFAGEWHTAVVLATLAAMPLLLGRGFVARTRTLAAAAIPALLILSPATGMLLGSAVSNLFQRRYWAVPVSVLFVIAILMALRLERRRWLAWLAIALLLLPLPLVGKQNIRPRWASWAAWPTARLPPTDLAAARRITEITPQNALAVAPREIWQALVMVPKHPRLLVARPQVRAPAMERYLSPAEYTARREIWLYSEGAQKSSHTPESFVRGIVDHAVHTVAIAAAHPHRAEIARRLEAAGYHAYEAAGTPIFSRTPPEQVPGQGGGGG